MLILTKSKLIEILDRYKIDISNWGKGESKTIDHLFTEIIKGESNIVEKKWIPTKKGVGPFNYC